MTTGNGFKNKSKRCSSFCFQNFVVEVAVEKNNKKKQQRHRYISSCFWVTKMTIRKAVPIT